jgi:hypothetical protein
MCALGQKQTYAVQQPMSALLPIATAKADSATGHVRFTPKSGHVQCTRPCLLWAKSGHSAHSFDHLIGGIQEPFRNRQTECLSGLEIDVQLDFSGLLHRQVGGLVALENPAGIDAS